MNILEAQNISGRVGYRLKHATAKHLNGRPMTCKVAGSFVVDDKGFWHLPVVIGRDNFLIHRGNCKEWELE